MENDLFELEKLLKNSLQFEGNELPDPDPSILLDLRKKVLLRKRPDNNFISTFMRIMNMDIKLYKAGLAFSVMLIFFVTLLTCGSQSKTSDNEGKLFADSSSFSNSPSLKQDSFLMKNSTKVR